MLLSEGSTVTSFCKSAAATVQLLSSAVKVNGDETTACAGVSAPCRLAAVIEAATGGATMAMGSLLSIERRCSSNAPVVPASKPTPGLSGTIDGPEAADIST